MNHSPIIMGICGAYAIRPYAKTQKSGEEKWND